MGGGGGEGDQKASPRYSFPPYQCISLQEPLGSLSQHSSSAQLGSPKVPCSLLAA